MENTLELSTVSYQRNQQLILNQINLTVAPGTIIGLLGENGSGKTTLMRCIAGLAQGVTGQITINGHSSVVERKAQVSYLDALGGFSRRTKIADVVEFYAAVYPDFNVDRYRELSDFLKNINGQQKLGDLSQGQKEKVLLSLALARQTAVYLLDEPFKGLDNHTRKQLLRSLVQWKSPDSVIIICDHYLTELTDVLDEVVILNEQQLVAREKISHLKQQQISLEDYYEQQLAQKWGE